MFTEVTDEEFRDIWTTLREENEKTLDIPFDINSMSEETVIELFEKNRFTFFTVKSNDFEQRKIIRGYVLWR